MMRTTKSAMAFPDRHAQPPGLHLAPELDGAGELDIARGLQAAGRDFPVGRKAYLLSLVWDDNPPKPSSAGVIRASIDWPGL